MTRHRRSSTRDMPCSQPGVGRCEMRAGCNTFPSQHTRRFGRTSALVWSSGYLGGRPSSALFRHCGVLSVSAVDGGTSGVSAFKSQSPSASPCRPSLSSASASCRHKQRRTTVLRRQQERENLHKSGRRKTRSWYAKLTR